MGGFFVPKTINQKNGGNYMEFFNQSIDILKVLVMALGAGLEMCIRDRTGTPPPKEIEQLLLKQGGHYPSSPPFSASVCGELPKGRKKKPSATASDYQLTLFPLC